MRKCNICGREMPDLKIFKGRRIVLPEVCSEKCLVELIKKQSFNGAYKSYIQADLYPSKFESVLEEIFYNKMRKYFYLEYSPFLLKLPKGKRYVPDFFFPDYGLFVEVKGVKGRISKANFASNFIPLFIITPDLMYLWGWLDGS